MLSDLPYACIFETHTKTSKLLGSTQRKDHEDHIARNGSIRWHIAIWYTSFFPCHKWWKFRMQRKPQWREMERARDNLSMGLGKSQEQEGGSSGSTQAKRSTKRQEESPFFNILWTYVTSKKCGVWTEATEVQRQSRALERHWDDSGACAVFTEHGSSAFHMTATKIMDVIGVTSWKNWGKHGLQTPGLPHSFARHA